MTKQFLLKLQKLEKLQGFVCSLLAESLIYIIVLGSLLCFSICHGIIWDSPFTCRSWSSSARQERERRWWTEGWQAGSTARSNTRASGTASPYTARTASPSSSGSASSRCERWVITGARLYSIAIESFTVMQHPCFLWQQQQINWKLL